MNHVDTSNKEPRKGLNCIICNEEKPDSESTIEHIFPAAIGGSLLLRDVCKPCNSYLGHSVDTALTDHFLILVKRAHLSVTGESGKLPNPFKGTHKDEDDRPIRFETDMDGNPIGFRYLDHVGPEESGRIEVLVDKTNSTELTKIVKKLYKRRGVTPPSDEEIRAQVRDVQELKTATLPVRIDLLEYQRAILKIAFELGLLWLGPSYWRDETAQKLRSIIFDKSPLDEQLAASLLNGQIQLHPPVDDEPWDGPWKTADHLHLAMLFINESGVFCAIRVFDVVYARVIISHDATKWINTQSPQLLVLNTRTKKHHEYKGQEDIVTAIMEASTIQTTNQKA